MKSPARPPAPRDPRNSFAEGGQVKLRGRRRIVIAICTLAVLSALVAWAKAAERPPLPASASAPQKEFSAERAWVDLERIAASAPHPAGEAAMAELYELSSQNTDFTVLKEESFVGLNFAFIDGGAFYHNPHDTVENFDSPTMQHQGANMLALARAFR